MSHQCGTKHRTYSTLARCRWPRADWIRGDGRFALFACCNNFTISLHETRDLAELQKVYIDSIGCGGFCRKNHWVVTLEEIKIGASK